MIVLGTSLSFVRVGWPGRAPFQSSVAAFGASTTSCVKRSRQSTVSRSNAVTSSVADFASSVLFVPQISSTVSRVKNAADLSSAYVFFSLRVMPTVYGRSSRLMEKYAGLGRRK